MSTRVFAYRQVISTAIRAAIKIAGRTGSVAILCLAMLALACVSRGRFIESAVAGSNPAPIVHLSASQTMGVIEGQYVNLFTSVYQVPGVGIGFGYGYTWTIYDGATAVISGARSNMVPDGFVFSEQLTAGLHSFQAVYSSTLSGYLTGTSNIVYIYVLTRQQATQNIINSVNVLSLQGVLNGGQDNSLVKQLQQAINQINAGKYDAAIGILNSFISEVNDLVSSGVLTQSQAAPLTSAAESLIATL